MNIAPTLGKRVNWIDWAKALCIYLVIIGHCHIDKTYDLCIQFIYSFHMPLFFILSGILSKNTLSKTAITKDAKNLLIPYITFGCIIILFHALTSHHLLSVSFYLYSLKDLLYGMDAHIGPIWFLPALFFCKMICYMIQWVEKHSIILYYFLAITSTCFIYIINQNKIDLPLFMDSGLCAVPFFFLGTKLLKSIPIEKIKKQPKLSIVTLPILLLATLACSYYNGGTSIVDCHYGNYILLFYLNAILGCNFIILLSILLDKYISSFIAIISYGTIIILGLHGIFLSIIQYYILHFIGYEAPTFNIFIGMALAFVSLLMCYIMILLIDKHFYRYFGLKGNKIQVTLKA